MPRNSSTTKARKASTTTRSSRSTTQRPTAPQRSRASSASAATKKKAASSARKAPARQKSQPQRATTNDAVTEAFADHGADLWGLILIALGLFAALSTFAEMAGPLGRLYDGFFGWLIGLVRAWLPIAMIGFGIVLVRGKADDPTPEGDHQLTTRFAVGAALTAIAVSGLLHVFRGRPGLDDGVDALSAAGGVLGVATGGTLLRIAAVWGALLVLGTISIVAFLVMSGITVRSIADATSGSLEGGREGGRSIGERLRWLLEAPGDRRVFDDLDLTDGVGDISDDYYGDDPSTMNFDPGYDAAADEAAANAIHSDDSDERRINVDPDTNPNAAAETSADENAAVAVPAKAAAPKVEVPARPKPPSAKKRAVAKKRGDWVLPPLSLLDVSDAQSIDKRAVEERGRVLENALAEHGVETRLVGMVVGPTVTRYELELGPGVKVARVTSLNKDIAYAMASPDVRILAPIPGRQAIGVEVPNANREIVALGDILGSQEARDADHPMEAALGRDINGRSMLANLASMPHILIAGATGAGKSSCINSLITSILMRATPDQVRMILVDPKMVEMGQYEQVPHLLTQPITDAKKAANALAWAVREMERRYELLSACSFRDIGGYNAAIAKGAVKPKLGEVDADGNPKVYEHMPYIVVVVDELADLMMVAARDVEESICRIAQKARAVGIHLVIATQRPSVNVITGVIKANVPARLAFAVSSLADSRVILDQPGAERLVGKGDMLLMGPASSTPHRVQGCWVTEEEVRNVVEFWREQQPELEEAPYDQAAEPGAEAQAATAEATAPTTGAPDPGASTAKPLPIANVPFPSAAPAASDSVDSVDSVDEVTAAAPPGTFGASGGSDDDELLGQAIELVVQSQLGSTSMLQRKLRVGFARAGRIMDLMEERGVVGPSEGSKAREVLLTPEELAAAQRG